eukprot:2047407-Karenia_brevis.AAC.1
MAQPQPLMPLQWPSTLDATGQCPMLDSSAMASESSTLGEAVALPAQAPLAASAGEASAAPS